MTPRSTAAGEDQPGKKEKDAAGARRAARRAQRRRRENHVHVELLLGRTVVDADSAEVGRIEEIVAEVQPGECTIVEFLVGRYALVDRLGGGRLAASLLRLLTRARAYEGYHIEWDQMDLTDPEHPRCTVRKEELQRAPG